MADVELLPLPEMGHFEHRYAGIPYRVRTAYTADQMHAYARANMEPLLAKVSVLSELAEFRGTTLAALDVAREDACELRRDNERLAKALRSSADALERLAFAIRAPNTHTPQLVELAIAMRAAALAQEDRND